jgi:DNA mismatch repair protein MutS
LQVAQLAGVPQSVIKAARKHLAALEAHSVQSTSQFDLFASIAPPDTEANARAQQEQHAAAITEALAGIDPDALSPREALEALYRLKTLAEEQ